MIDIVVQAAKVFSISASKSFAAGFNEFLEFCRYPGHVVHMKLDIATNALKGFKHFKRLLSTLREAMQTVKFRKEPLSFMTIK